MTDQPLINPAVLMESVANNPDLFQDLVEVFCNTFPQDLERVKHAAQTRDADQVRRILHRIKGALQLLGATTTVSKIDLFSDSIKHHTDLAHSDSLTEILGDLSRIVEDVNALKRPIDMVHSSNRSIGK